MRDTGNGTATTDRYRRTHHAARRVRRRECGSVRWASTERLQRFEQLMAAQERSRERSRHGVRGAVPSLRRTVRVPVARPRLRPIEDDYRWLAKIYKSIAPTGVADKLLWHRLGAKTAELIAEYVTDVEVDPSGLEEIAVDAGVFEALRDLNCSGSDRSAPSPDRCRGARHARSAVAPQARGSRRASGLAHAWPNDSKHCAKRELADAAASVRVPEGDPRPRAGSSSKPKNARRRARSTTCAFWRIRTRAR